MNIPIRVMGIATTFFWVFLIAFSVSAIYSAKDVHFDFGEPQMWVNANNETVFSLPVSVANRGFYNIGSFNLTTEISDEEGLIITRESTFIPVIRKSEELTTSHNVTIDVNDLLQIDQKYLFNDAELKIYGIVNMIIAKVIPVQASTNVSIPWGAPLCNFIFGKPEHTAYNYTHLRVVVPISFENHAFFDLSGKIQIRMYNSANTLVGDGQVAIEVRSNSLYHGYTELYVLIAGMTESGCFEVDFLTSFFNYGPLVVSYG